MTTPMPVSARAARSKSGSNAAADPGRPASACARITVPSPELSREPAERLAALLVVLELIVARAGGGEAHDVARLREGARAAHCPGEVAAALGRYEPAELALDGG